MGGFETVTSYLPFWAVASSMAAVPLILASSRSPNLREVWTLLAGMAKFALVMGIAYRLQQGMIIEATLFEISPGIGLTLRADPFGLFFATIASSLWILTSIFSIGYMRCHHERNQTRYFASFALSLSATLGIAFSANLLTFVVFYELLTLSTYPLVVHQESDEAIRAGRQYLAYSLTSGVLLILAAGWVYQMTGDVRFQPGGILAGADLGSFRAWALFLVFLVGVGVKSALMPLHSWLPTAMVAPTPVSALLHAVAVVKSGVFGVIRIVGYVFGPDMMRAHRMDLLLAIMAGATILLASFIAMRQDNLKRRLAYSTVGHLSYIILGAALLTPSGLVGGLFHISTHAFMKITLFFCAGAILVHVHKERVSELDGVGRAMPWTMGAFTIGAIGLAGIPPVNGFVSKWFLCIGAVQAGSPVALAVYLGSGLLNAGYFFPVVYRAFFKRSEKFSKYGEASPWMVVPLCLAALLALVFGVSPNFLLGLFDLVEAVQTSIIP